MRIYKRGQTYWCEFRLDNKHYQYSCKTKEKETAQEIAAAIYADTIRDRFNIPVKNKAQRLFTETYQEYLKSLSNSTKTVINKNIAFKHFLQVFKDKNIAEITTTDIKTYQLQRRLEIMNKNAGKKESEINFDWLN